MCMLEIIYDDTLMHISSSSVLGSLKTVARVLQHGYWQMQQIRAFSLTTSSVFWRVKNIQNVKYFCTPLETMLG